MPVVDDSRPVVGLYAAVIAAHEQELETYAANKVPAPPILFERLEAMRRGEPVDVPAYFLPQAVRPRRAAGGMGLRAVVTADDAVTLRDETVRDWLDEEGL
jgi:hypothetical protein